MLYVGGIVFSPSLARCFAKSAGQVTFEEENELEKQPEVEARRGVVTGFAMLFARQVSLKSPSPVGSISAKAPVQLRPLGAPFRDPLGDLLEHLPFQ